MKKTVKLTETDLHNLIKESVLTILKENYPDGSEFDSNAPWNQKDSEYNVINGNVIIKLTLPVALMSLEDDNEEFIKSLLYEYHIYDMLKDFYFKIQDWDYIEDENGEYVPEVYIIVDIEFPCPCEYDDFEECFIADKDNINYEEGLEQSGLYNALEGINFEIIDYNIE